MLNLLSRHSWGWLLSLLVLAPAIMVVVTERDVNALDFARDVNPDSLGAWLGRSFVVAVLSLLALTLVGMSSGNVLPSRNRKYAAFLRLALIGFVAGYTVLPSLLGAEGLDGTSMFYGSLVLFVAYGAGRLPSSPVLAAVKTAFLVLMLAGIVSAVLAPGLSVQYSEAAVRLPFIDFRFWGLGSNPNNIAPLAVVLLLMLIYQPYKHVALNAAAYVSAGLTLLLAQSQTTWMAALVVLPLFTLYRVLPKPVRKARIDPFVFVGMLILTAIGVLLLLWELTQVDFSLLTESASSLSQGNAGSIGEGAADDSLLARVEIWQLALDTWRDHFWFGYGPQAWGTEFRVNAGMAYAYNAHNQFMQTVSIGGTVALISLVGYLLTLMMLCLRTAEQSHGLTMALFALIVVRCLTEAPLDTHTLLSGELLMHALLVYLLAVFLWRNPVVSAPSSRSRVRRRRSTR